MYVSNGTKPINVPRALVQDMISCLNACSAWAVEWLVRKETQSVFAYGSMTCDGASKLRYDLLVMSGDVEESVTGRIP